MARPTAHNQTQLDLVMGHDTSRNPDLRPLRSVRTKNARRRLQEEERPWRERIPQLGSVIASTGASVGGFATATANGRRKAAHATYR